MTKVLMTSITEAHRSVINLLIDLARAAYVAADATEDQGDNDWVGMNRASYDELSSALDNLEALPDDKPGIVMGPAAKAEWALRALLDRDACAASFGPPGWAEECSANIKPSQQDIAETILHELVVAHESYNDSHPLHESVDRSERLMEAWSLAHSYVTAPQPAPQQLATTTEDRRDLLFANECVLQIEDCDYMTEEVRRSISATLCRIAGSASLATPAVEYAQTALNSEIVQKEQYGRLLDVAIYLVGHLNKHLNELESIQLTNDGRSSNV